MLIIVVTGDSTLTAEILISILIFVSDVRPQPPDHQVHKDLRVSQDHKVSKVFLAKQDLKDQLDHKDTIGLTGPEGPKGGAGEQGETGPQGEIGPQGEQGPPGPEQVIEVRQVVGNPVGSGLESVATCDSDEVVVGGGFLITEDVGTVLKNRAEGNSWVVSGSDLTVGPFQSTFQAYAECADLQQV